MRATLARTSGLASMAVRFARGARGLGGLFLSGAVAAARRSLLGVLAGLRDLVGGALGVLLQGFTCLARHAAQPLARLAQADHGLPQALCGLVRDRGKAFAAFGRRLEQGFGGLI